MKLAKRKKGRPAGTDSRESCTAFATESEPCPAGEPRQASTKTSKPRSSPVSRLTRGFADTAMET
jgi:hypothetical protein